MGTLLSYMKFVPLVPKCHVAFQYQRYHKYWFFLYFLYLFPLAHWHKWHKVCALAPKRHVAFWAETACTQHAKRKTKKEFTFY